MFHGRKANERINHIHERALRIVYKDNNSSFMELLHKDNSHSVHQKNIQFLAIELYKVKNNFSTDIMNELFPLRESNYNLRKQGDFAISALNTSTYGISSLRFFASKIWREIPNEIKELKTVDQFKTKIKKWTPVCHCRLCKVYIKDVGYHGLL